MQRSQKRLGEILIEKGKLTPQQLELALREQAVTKEFLGALLIRRFALQESDIAKALAEQFDMPIVNLKDKSINWNLVKEFVK